VINYFINPFTQAGINNSENPAKHPIHCLNQLFYVFLTTGLYFGGTFHLNENSNTYLVPMIRPDESGRNHESKHQGKPFVADLE
jgi:hypothetical protein